jgi:hypothetical protein
MSKAVLPTHVYSIFLIFQQFLQLFEGWQHWIPWLPLGKHWSPSGKHWPALVKHRLSLVKLANHRPASASIVGIGWKFLSFDILQLNSEMAIDYQLHRVTNAKVWYC